MCKKSYKKLYLHILKAGIKKLGSGLSYNELISELKKKGYDIDNDCIDKAIKHWFVDSFAHYDNTENGTEQIEMDTVKLENHKYCGCILKGKSCLAYLEYQNSRRTLKATGIAALIALIALLYTVFGNCLINLIKNLL
ncbi:MAG: hypothetical protein LBR28_03845 [Bacteroidales bacterium]|jgi:hypothetical protein|nr:hypothetical protein [Bacteroidales bacterium]